MVIETEKKEQNQVIKKMMTISDKLGSKSIDLIECTLSVEVHKNSIEITKANFNRLPYIW